MIFFARCDPIGYHAVGIRSFSMMNDSFGEIEVSITDSSSTDQDLPSPPQQTSVLKMLHPVLTGVVDGSLISAGCNKILDLRREMMEVLEKDGPGSLRYKNLSSKLIALGIASGLDMKTEIQNMAYLAKIYDWDGSRKAQKERNLPPSMPPSNDLRNLIEEVSEE